MAASRALYTLYSVQNRAIIRYVGIPRKTVRSDERHVISSEYECDLA